MKTKNIIIYLIICLIIIAGIAVWNFNGFNKELQYSSRYKIMLNKDTGFKTKDVKKIVDDVLGNTRHFVQEVEIFGNAVSVVSEEMTEEQKNKIVEKFNEKYEDSELSTENVTITKIPSTRVKDIIKHFIVPGIITLVAISIYFLIKYKKLGIKTVLLNSILMPIIAEALLFSIIAITRLPLMRITFAIGIGVYFVTILVLTCIFENKNSKYIEEQKNKEE